MRLGRLFIGDIGDRGGGEGVRGVTGVVFEVDILSEVGSKMGEPRENEFERERREELGGSVAIRPC